MGWFRRPDCELGHHGEDVSFNSILKKYDLTSPALLLLGEIVRAADSNHILIRIRPGTRRHFCLAKLPFFRSMKIMKAAESLFTYIARECLRQANFS